MQIIVSELSKKYINDTIFSKLNYTFKLGSKTAITGANGSGKSTLLQILSGFINPTKGKIEYQLNETSISIDDIHAYIGYASPYMELAEDFTLLELLEFHYSFREKYKFSDFDELLEIGYLTAHKNKQIKFFSSGMKQRLKLLLAIFSKNPLLMLDEPTSNMDATGIQWYQDILKQHLDGRTLLICSNQEFEYNICDEVIKISDYQH